MLNRTHQAFQARFRALLARAGARRPDAGWQWFLASAARLGQQQSLSPTRALTAVYRAALRRCRHWPARFLTAPDGTPPRFLCDAGLGALARWLRASGYDTAWSPDITDDEMIEEARRRGAIALTTDSLLMERRPFRDGEVPAVWLPSPLTPLEQLALLFDELRLPLRPSLCMTCGGPLHSVDKEAMREHIPPRTYRWLDHYFQCQRCGQLFWHGTHWRRIQQRLAEM
jgi:uncharacterized protein